MTTIRQRTQRFFAAKPSWLLPALLVVLGVLGGNALYVLHLTNNDPLVWTTNISRSLCNVACGRSAIDPNVGFITQSLGRLSATDLLHGHWPFWNPFEGLGAPLLGEMQVAAFFPLTLFFALNSGLLWFHVSLEIIAGVSTYFFFRRLSLPAGIATVGGVLFALNGTYAWLGNAVLNPVAFLPMLLWGVEVIIDRAAQPRRWGLFIMIFALALSLVSGFPEVAYFDTLFAGAWAILRLIQTQKPLRLRLVRRFVLAGVGGLLLALPALIAFYDYLKVADIGAHAATDAGMHVPMNGLAMFFDPYVYGTLFSNGAITGTWGVIGGYFTLSVGLLALVGLVGRDQRPWRITLGVWILINGLALFNILHFHQLLNIIPLVKNAAYPRYIMPSLELAMILLCALGLNDLAQRAEARTTVRRVSWFMLAASLFITYQARRDNATYHLSSKAHVFFYALQAVPILVAVVAVVVSYRGSRERQVVTLGALVILEALFMFAVPSAEAPKQITVDNAAIRFLQTHVGPDYRFYDLGLIEPNWGSFYGINELSSIDLPFPKNFTAYIQRNLYPGMTPNNQFIAHGAPGSFASEENALTQHFASYEAVGVKYLTVSTGQSLDAQLIADGLKVAYMDNIATIYLLPHPTPIVSLTGGTTGCQLRSKNVNIATVTCAQTTTLLRTENAMPGWHVSINGRAAHLQTVDGTFQSVSVPAGTSTITFSFTPPHEKVALLAAGATVVALGGLWWYERRRLR